MVDPAGRGRGDDDRLRVDHLAHHAAGAVGRAHQVRAEAELLGRDPLHAAEQHVRRGVGAGQRDAEPAHQGAEERIEDAGVGERQAERGVEARVARQRAEPEHEHDGEQRVAHLPQGAAVVLHQLQRVVLHQQPADDRREQDAGAGRREQVEGVDRAFLGRLRSPPAAPSRSAGAGRRSGKFGAKMPLSAFFTGGSPQMKTKTLRTSHGIQARMTTSRGCCLKVLAAAALPTRRSRPPACRARRDPDSAPAC